MNHRKRKKVLVSRMLLTAGCYEFFLHSEPRMYEVLKYGDHARYSTELLKD